MQIRIGPSRSIIYKCPDSLVTPLMEEFTYTNSSVSYQLHKHKSGRFRFLQAARASSAMNSADAERMFREEKERLEGLLKPCLIKPTKDGLLVFPTGLLSKVTDFCKKRAIDMDNILVDMRKKPKETNGFPFTGAPAKLRPYQKEAVEAILKVGQGTIVSGTGTGKTVIIQEVIRKLGLKTVVVVPSLSILSQTEERFKKYFGRGKVGSFSGKSKKIKNITLACAPSLAKSDPKIWGDVDVLIFDECHHTPCDTIETIVYQMFPRAYYRLGFTATYHRTDGADLAIEAAVFPPVYTYTVERGIEEGFLAKPRFLMFTVGFDSYSRYTGKMPVFAYKNHLIRNSALNIKIIAHVNKFIGEGKQVLMLVREKTHGHLLAQGIPGAVFVRNKGDEKSIRNPAPYVNSDDAVADFNSKKIKCLIGTSIIGEGTDIVPVDVLFNLMGGTSKVTVMQNIGRALRPSPGKDTVWIIDYIYQNNSMLEKHSLKRYNIYKKIGKVDIIELKR